MKRRTGLLVGIAILAVTVVVAGALAVLVTSPDGPIGSPGSTRQSPGDDVPRTAKEASTAFIERWVDDDGRVVRRDQGNDTVSEGQAYGMLIAVAANDEAAFERMWAWTKTNMMREDGLLAWHWADGEIKDNTPASDAELDAARALVLAGAKFKRAEWTADGNTLGKDLLDTMTRETTLGRLIAPGLWAMHTDDFSYNASYASPAAYSVLYRASGDERWNELAQGSATVTEDLLDQSPLPPDWAQVNEDGSLDPLPGPNGQGAGVRYSYDAVRTPIRYAESCEAADRELAGRMSAPLNRNNPLPVTLDLGGDEIEPQEHPVGYVARAAARAASGDGDGARTDLNRAAELDTESPSYYGAAWVAIGLAMLETKDLGGCGPLAPTTATPAQS